MSFFRWLIGARKPHRAGTHQAQGHARSPEPAATQRSERTQRRELLYTVVREAMMRASVLSAGYKFKVLSLDQRGQQFMVMVDLGREYGGENVRLSAIEALIVQTAHTRFAIGVTAVYWRINDQIGAGVPSAALGARAVQAAAVRSAARAPAATPDPARPAQDGPPVPAGAVAVAGGFEPIGADEVEAFKQALQAGAPGSVGDGAAKQSPAAPTAQAPQPPRGKVRIGPLQERGAAQRTGFEDTRASSPQASPPWSDHLSKTQFGDL